MTERRQVIGQVRLGNQGAAADGAVLELRQNMRALPSLLLQQTVRGAKLLDDLIVAVRDTSGKKTTTKKINCLVIIDVHARDIIDKFVRDSVLDEREFAWESQLRFSWDRDADDVVIDQDALRDVLKRALIHGGLKRGLREVAKALDSRTAKLCCLAKDCDNAEYSNLVRALCDEGGVSLVMVDEGKQLGEWAGLCKINEEGEATSVVRCSAACVTEFGEDTRALSVLLTYLKAQAPEDK